MFRPTIRRRRIAVASKHDAATALLLQLATRAAALMHVDEYVPPALGVSARQGSSCGASVATLKMEGGFATMEMEFESTAACPADVKRSETSTTPSNAGIVKDADVILFSVKGTSRACGEPSTSPARSRGATSAYPVQILDNIAEEEISGSGKFTPRKVTTKPPRVGPFCGVTLCIVGLRKENR